MNSAAAITTLGALDYLVIVLYGVILLGLGVWSRFTRKQNTEEYLLARHSMHYLVVALAVFATLFSTISFVSSPGEAYSFGLVMMLGSIGYIIFLPLAIRLFLRFFFNAPTFTAYEYLERRFDRKCRVTAAGIFLVIRLFYTASVFYAATVIFQTMLGWPPEGTMLIIGAVTVVYACMGGVRAVILADVIQSVIIVCGVTAILFRLLQVTGFDIAGVFAFAHGHNRLFETMAQPEFYRFNFQDRYNLYLLAIGTVLAPLVSMSCDQMVIQRLLAGKNYRQAVRATYLNYLIGLPVVVMLFVIGLFLFYHYNAGALRLPEGVSGDQALGYFVATELPAPLPGIIVTALLSALMSTVAGAVNSLVTVLMKDVIVLFNPALAGTAREVDWCRRLTVVGGISAVLVALVIYWSGRHVRTTVMEVVGVWGTLWPILFAIFLYGVTSQKVSAKAIFVSLLISGAVGLAFPYVSYYLLPEAYRWGFSWVGIPGLILALTLPPVFAVIWPNTRDLTGLTLKTTRDFIRDNR